MGTDEELRVIRQVIKDLRELQERVGRKTEAARLSHASIQMSIGMLKIKYSIEE